MPSRKQRNQPSSRVHDIEFATEISTSLLAQVRQLQSLLAERDETLKAINLEKSRLELEAEGFSQRLRALDESEHRYKDENWNLETQTHDLLAAAKEATDRENRLNSTLSAVTSEKINAQRELDELKQTNGKLQEDHAAAQKAHDSEVHTMRRNMTSGDTERETLQRKVEELTSQNQELAMAVAARFRHQEPEGMRDFSENEDMVRDISTPEHSPPPSPNKGTPRHGMLESETLKSSLHHAHRMIQNLKGNIHREKTEKVELKRMLQEARDELELRRGEPGGPGSGSKRQKSKSDTFKKPPRPDMLGAGRRSRTDIETEELDWEDHAGEISPIQNAASKYLQVGSGGHSGRTTDLSDAYQTANETEDAFETANERDTATESEAFQTGAESIAGDSTDELTETEARSGQGGTLRGKKPPTLLSLGKPGNRSSFMSTASTSAGEEDEDDLHTPVQTQPQKYRLKIGRGGVARRSRASGDAATLGGSNQSSAKNSPASFASNRSPPAQGGQSLFAELSDLNGGGSDGEFGTPGRSSIISHGSTPGGQPGTGKKSLAQSELMPVPDVTLIDSGTMTEPWEPSLYQHIHPTDVAVAGIAGTAAGNALRQHPEGQNTDLVDSGTQYTPQKNVQIRPQSLMSTFPTPPKTIWDESADGSKPTFDSSSEGVARAPSRTPQHQSSGLTLSAVSSQQTEPESPLTPRKHLGPHPAASLTLSPIHMQETLPAESPKVPVPSPNGNKQTTAAKSVGTDADAESITGRPRTSQSSKQDAKTGILGSVFGWGKSKTTQSPNIAEDVTSQPSQGGPEATNETSTIPFKDISGNVGAKEPGISEQAKLKGVAERPVSIDTTDQSAQTILSSEQIDQILVEKDKKPATSPVAEKMIFEQVVPKPVPLVVAPRANRSRSQASIPEASFVGEPAPLAIQTTPKRPGSANSQRMSSSSSHPPLPPDHRQAIAAAAQRNPSEGPNGVMGPPVAPASAYRRPRTPVDQATQSPGSRGGTTPRARGRHGSQISRRSSVSSFASELDERFNIRADGMAVPGQGFDPGTDPRMIQAITQTMIGEFLWKYTRKAGRPEMSSRRHMRYFWVHPYTRTLYWSDQDPQGAGRSELKAKSVAIQAVRVITDDNPMPPGLHRKSLEVITPGRKVKFTAATGQRHETWFNALSYILLRTAAEGGNEAVDGNNITAEDVDEFNPSFSGRNYSQRNGSRRSLSSYNSRTTRNTSTQGRSNSRLSMRTPATPGVAGEQPSASTASSRHTSQQPSQDTARQGSISRLSSMFKPATIRGSFSSRRSRHSQAGGEGESSVYNASVVSEHDSAEDLRKVIEKQERDADRLENVRACCDG